MKYKISAEEQNKHLDSARQSLATQGISFENSEVTSKYRGDDLTGVRSLIAFVLREKGLSFPKIGAVLNRDHATAMHLLKHYEKRNRYLIPNFQTIKNSLSRTVNKEQVNKQIIYHLKQIEILKKSL